MAIGLRQLVEQVIAIADEATGGPTGLQSTITIHPYTGETLYGVDTYGTPETVPAFVSYKQAPVQSRTGQTIISKASVIILKKLTRAIDINDKIVLPDGTSGPIIDVSGFANPDTSKPFTNKIFIGKEPTGR